MHPYNPKTRCSLLDSLQHLLRDIRLLASADRQHVDCFADRSSLAGRVELFASKVQAKKSIPKPAFASLVNQGKGNVIDACRTIRKRQDSVFDAVQSSAMGPHASSSVIILTLKG